MKQDIFGSLYYLGVVVILPLYNSLLDLLQGGATRTYDFTLSLWIAPVGGIAVGAYLLLNQWVKPAMPVRIVCKSVLVLFLFFGWSFLWTAYMPVIRLVDRLTYLTPVVCGYFLVSLIVDIREACRNRKN